MDVRENRCQVWVISIFSGITMISNEFLKLFEVAVNHKPSLNLDISYSKRCDWILVIREEGVEIVLINHCDLALVLAKAYVELAEWLSENNGGY